MEMEMEGSERGRGEVWGFLLLLVRRVGNIPILADISA